MKRTLKMITEELHAMGLYLETVPKWYRNRRLKGMKQYYVKGGSKEHWMGSDGESNWSPRVCVFIAVKSVSEITTDLIRSEYTRTHDGKNIEAALKVAKKEQKKEDERVAKIKVEMEAERKAKAKRSSLKATEETITKRKASISKRFAEGFKSKDKALTVFARMHSGSILADHYREEFLSLIQNTGILSMAMDVCALQFPDLRDMMLLLNERAHALKIQSGSIGGVRSAIAYLCQDFVEVE